MPNYKGNPNIQKYGEATRFGKANGNDPNIARLHGARPWEVRNALRRFMRLTVKEFEERCTQIHKMPLGEAVAALKIKKAMNGNILMMERVTDDVDGKHAKIQIDSDINLISTILGSNV